MLIPEPASAPAAFERKPGMRMLEPMTQTMATIEVVTCAPGNFFLISATQMSMLSESSGMKCEMVLALVLGLLLLLEI